MTTENDIHRAVGLSALSILQATQCALDRLTPEQRETIAARFAQGGVRYAQVILNDGHNVHVELGLVADGFPGFDEPLLRMDGPITAAAAPPGSVTVTDRRKMS